MPWAFERKLLPGPRLLFVPSLTVWAEHVCMAEPGVDVVCMYQKLFIVYFETVKNPSLSKAFYCIVCCES